MKIVFLDPIPWDYHVETPLTQPLGGSQSGVCYLAAEFARLGHDVSLINHCVTPGEYAGVRCPGWRDGFDAATLNQADAIIVVNAARARSLRRMGLRVPLFQWTGHAPGRQPMQELHDAQERDLWQGFAFVSRWQQEQYLRAFAIPLERSHVLHNGIAPPFAEESSAAPWFVSSSPPTLVYTSVPNRGLDVLLDAFPIVQAAIPAVQLRIYSGMGLYQVTTQDDPYRDLYERSRTMPGVEYRGPVGQRQLAHELRSAAMLAYPCVVPETFCIAAAEAMALGAFLATTKMGALTELFGEFAFVVETETERGKLIERYAALVIDAITSLAQSPDEAIARRNSQMDFIAANYTWTCIAPQWIAWLEQSLVASAFPTAHHGLAPIETGARPVLAGMSRTNEWQLLLASARVVPTNDEQAKLRELLRHDIDWAAFTRLALAHELAPLSGHTLSQIAPDLLPDDLLDAFRTVIDQTRQNNLALFDELTTLLDCLVADGIDAIPFKGPVLAIDGYGDLGLRVFKDSDVLVRDRDFVPTIATLTRLEFERRGPLSAAKQDLLRRSRGHETLIRRGTGLAVSPHTRLMPMARAVNLDYAALWQRAERRVLNGRKVLTLSSEDHLLALAVTGARDMWSNPKWVSDVAAFVASHPSLDWDALTMRARTEGCRRLLLLALALARDCFDAGIPDALEKTARADPVISMLVQRIVTQWAADGRRRPRLANMRDSEWLHLQDGFARKARYLVRSRLLPTPRQISEFTTRTSSLAQVRIEIAANMLKRSLHRAFDEIREGTMSLRETLGRSDLALAIAPASTEARSTMRSHQRAREAAGKRLRTNPADGAAWRQLADAYAGLGSFRRALVSYEKAMSFAPDSQMIWLKRKAVLTAIGRSAGLPDVARDPQGATDWTVRAGTLLHLERYPEASDACDRALALDPDNVDAARIGIRSRLLSCDWRRRDEDKRRVTAGLTAGKRVIQPFFHCTMCDSEAELRLGAKVRAGGLPLSSEPLWTGERYRHDKIRIAYLSTDFRSHAVATLIVGCFEEHDRTRFETTAISLSPDDGKNLRTRIEASFDRFVAAHKMSDPGVAELLRELEIDIVVDLNGYTGIVRSEILAFRPVPVQVNFLGYPGTMDAPFIDYIVADRVVIPNGHQCHYREKVVYLPHRYQPNDSRRRVITDFPSRAEAGLPESGFVFACFNNSCKISPEMFGIWMQILRDIPDSVLWLFRDTSAVAANLRREAISRGIASDRLVFAPRLPQPEHLARHALADLFLDTLPYNAHTTTSDALWVGLPVLTCRGTTFAGRVAASLLFAIGLPELVTTSLIEYEAMAKTLAREPERLAAIKSKLVRNRQTEPLFDTTRFTRHLETAYTTMWERQQAGLAPESFAVPSRA